MLETLLASFRLFSQLPPERRERVRSLPLLMLGSLYFRIDSVALRLVKSRGQLSFLVYRMTVYISIRISVDPMPLVSHEVVSARHLFRRAGK